MNIVEALRNREEVWNSDYEGKINFNYHHCVMVFYRRNDHSFENHRLWLSNVLPWLSKHMCLFSLVFVWACGNAFQILGDDTLVVDFFLRIHPPSDEALINGMRHVLLLRSMKIVQRLLDAGVSTLVYQRRDGIELNAESLTLFTQLYDHRLDTRAIARAVLHVASRRETRRWVARDVWRIVAKMVWSQRFEMGK